MDYDIELSSVSSSSVTVQHSRIFPKMPNGSDADVSRSTSPDQSPFRGSRRPQWETPKSIRDRIGAFFRSAWRGPEYPQDEAPEPIRLLMALERIPEKFRTKVSSPFRTLLLALYLAVWISIWAKVLFPYLSESPTVAGSGAKVVSLTCGQAGDFWRGKNAACGLDAHRCPALNHTDDVIFRCPAFCDRGSWLYSLRAVGNQIIKYRGYFIGGGAAQNTDKALSRPYRADSFPCGAGVHAGVVSPFFGGCARISYSSGAKLTFPAAKGRYGVSDSVEFGSFFPHSYYFKALATNVGYCYDPRLLVLLLNMILGIPVVFLGSGSAFFWVLSVVGFWTISLATDPPVLVEPQDPESLYKLISLSVERFLPTCFVLFFLWKVSVKRTFGSLKDPINMEMTPEAIEQISSDPRTPTYSPVTRLVLWYPFFWLGILNNISFDRLPVDRLTWHDMQAQPGAMLTVILLAFVVVVCIVAQAYYVWLLGRFWRLLLVYGLLFFSLFLLAQIPGLTLRVHHYTFALILFPGCLTRSRTAYVFQGLLLGLFLSGVARWGFASIAETDLSLLRGEPLGKIYAPQIAGFTEGVLYWHDNPATKNSLALKELEKYSQVSLLVNDVERYVGDNTDSLNLTLLFQSNKDLSSLIQSSLLSGGEGRNIELYLRLAKYAPGRKKYGDYTRASILKLPSLEFETAPPGIT